MEFCRRLTAVTGVVVTLPTEAQWEYACRAGTETEFSFGQCLSSGDANYNGHYPMADCPPGEFRESTWAAGSGRANGWGLYGMHGNVSEWCRDWMGGYPSEAVTDPGGPASGTKRIGRGGNWFLSAVYCSSAWRGQAPPGYKSSHVGFRILIED